MRVKAATANRGVISAHNLHIACSFEDDNGNIETNIAHPRKKPMDFKIVIPTFFKMNTSQLQFVNENLILKIYYIKNHAPSTRAAAPQ